MEFKWLNKSLIKQTKDRIEIMAPVGNGGIRVHENLSIEKNTVRNIREGK